MRKRVSATSAPTKATGTSRISQSAPDPAASAPNAPACRTGGGRCDGEGLGWLVTLGPDVRRPPRPGPSGSCRGDGHDASASAQISARDAVPFLRKQPAQPAATEPLFQLPDG
jgi:hypothetical protein